jgi:hypothetical protein
MAMLMAQGLPDKKHSFSKKTRYESLDSAYLPPSWLCLPRDVDEALLD